MNETDPKLLSQFEQRNQFEELLEIRSKLKEVFGENQLKNLMRNNGDLQGLEIVVIADTPDPDSDASLMFEGLLQDDLNQFFFGASVKVMDEESNDMEKKNIKLPRAC